VNHLASVIEALDSAPFIIGHSFGGTLTQLLLARGVAALRHRRAGQLGLGLRADREPQAGSPGDMG
jgi:hypothetical protein